MISKLICSAQSHNTEVNKTSTFHKDPGADLYAVYQIEAGREQCAHLSSCWGGKTANPSQLMYYKHQHNYPLDNRKHRRGEAKAKTKVTISG
jgi:hypothetical protein